MKRLFLLVGLCLMASLVVAPAAMAQVVPDDGNPATLENTCEGIVSQEDFEACVAEQQAAGNPDYTDDSPQVGDTCPAGYAAFGDPGTGQLTCIPPGDPSTIQYQADTPAETYSELPDTGGPSMLLPLGALLVGAGILAYAVIRRR